MNLRMQKSNLWQMQRNNVDIFLAGKYTCHGGISTAAGWVYPLAFLISNGWIRPYGCNAIRAAAEYFTKSCIPGALSSEYNTGVPYDNMCDLCHGASYRYTRVLKRHTCIVSKSRFCIFS